MMFLKQIEPKSENTMFRPDSFAASKKLPAEPPLTDVSHAPRMRRRLSTLRGCVRRRARLRETERKITLSSPSLHPEPFLPTDQDTHFYGYKSFWPSQFLNCIRCLLCSFPSLVLCLYVHFAVVVLIAAVPDSNLQIGPEARAPLPPPSSHSTPLPLSPPLVCTHLQIE